METATQPNLITVCDKCFTVACWSGVVMCSRAQGAGTITDTPANISKMAYGLAPAPQETPARHSPLPWKWLPDEGQFIVDAKGNIVAEIPCQGCNPIDGGLIVKCVNRNPAFQRLVEAAQAALTNIEGLLDNNDLPSIVVRNMLREALRLAREGEK